MRVFLFLLIAFSLYGNEAQKAAQKLGYLNNYKAAIEKARENDNKIVMLLVVQDGCHWCKKFERVTLSDEKIKKKIEPFVKVVLDRYDAMPPKFESKFFPMVYFIDSQTEQILALSYGYRTKALFVEDMKPLQKTIKEP